MVFGYRPFRAHSSGQTVINFVSVSLWMMPTCAGAENGFSAEPSESADPEAEPLCSGAQHESVRSRLTPEPCNGPCLSSNLLNTNLKSCPSADPSAGSGLGSVGAAPARLRPCPDGPEVHSGPWLDDFVLVPASKVFLHAPQQNLRRGSDGSAAKRASGCASRLHAGWMHCSVRRAGWAGACATSAVGVAEPAIWVAEAAIRAAASLIFGSSDSAMALTVAAASGMALTAASESDVHGIPGMGREPLGSGPEARDSVSP